MATMDVYTDAETGSQVHDRPVTRKSKKHTVNVWNVTLTVAALDNRDDLDMSADIIEALATLRVGGFLLLKSEISA